MPVAAPDGASGESCYRFATGLKGIPPPTRGDMETVDTVSPQNNGETTSPLRVTLRLNII